MSKTRSGLYERINFLPFADAMFSGVAIVIIILVSFNQRSAETVSHPQADMVLRCDQGATIGSYSVTIVNASAPIPGFAQGRVIEDAKIAADVENWLSQWPDLSARILLQENPENGGCAVQLRSELETVQKRVAIEGRSGKAIPLISVAYAPSAPASDGKER